MATRVYIYTYAFHAILHCNIRLFLVDEVDDVAARARASLDNRVTLSEQVVECLVVAKAERDVVTAVGLFVLVRLLL
jgi:hypothetical protein